MKKSYSLTKATVRKVRVKSGPAKGAFKPVAVKPHVNILNRIGKKKR